MNYLITSKISGAESAYRSTHFADVVSNLTTRLSCTKCNGIIKPRMVTDNNVHPVLEVLLCRKCRHFYDQRQSPDSRVCTWCANDHQSSLFGCSSCSAKFCENCINRNFHLARTIFQEINQGKWKCCICFSKPIWSQRAICAAAKKFADSSNKALKERIAHCNAVKNSKRSLSVPSHIVATQPATFATSLPRPRLASISKPEQKLESVATDDSAGAVSAGENSWEQYKNESNDCVICLLNPPIMVLYPCGHKCLCKQCSEVLPLREKLCPLCRKQFHDIIQLYE